MNVHNCSLAPKTILKLKINVFLSPEGREKSVCLRTTGCGCLFKFSNLYNQFTNEYISITPVNSYVFLMQESVLFGLSLSLSLSFPPRKCTTWRRMCGCCKNEWFSSCKDIMASCTLGNVLGADDWCQQWLQLNSAENVLSSSVPQLTQHSAMFQVVWLKSEEALIPLAWY